MAVEVFLTLSYACYLPEDEPCYNSLDGGFYYRGPVRVTARGQCQSWRGVFLVDRTELYDYVGLEDNHCRNSVVLETEDAPWCYSGGMKTDCGLQACPGRDTESKITLPLPLHIALPSPPLLQLLQLLLLLYDRGRVV